MYMVLAIAGHFHSATKLAEGCIQKNTSNDNNHESATLPLQAYSSVPKFESRTECC